MIKRIIFGCTTILVSAVLSAYDLNKVPPDNWTVPQTQTVSRIRTLADATSPRAFIGLPPCRLLDTRGAPIGGGIFANGESRNYTFTGSCGIPSSGFAGPIALSLNITVTGAPSAPPGAFLLAWPQAGAVPPVSILNYQAGQTVANAAIVPTGASNGITVNVSHSVHVIIDVNGYFSNALGTPGNYFEIDNNSGGYSIYTTNSSTSCPGACGIFAGISSTSGAIAIDGAANGASGRNYGVLGFEASNSAGSAGVQGLAYSGNPAGAFQFAPAAVLGLAASVPDFEAGVHGITQSGGGFGGRFTRNSTTSPFSPTADVQLANSDGNAASFFGNVGIGAGGGNPGNLNVAGTLTKGAGAFKIDHPLDPENKYLYHSFVESPDMMNIYNGNVVLDHNGEAIVELPAYFEALNMDFRYQLTSIGRFSPVYVADEIHANQFRIAGGRQGAKVSWQVTGIRHDAYANAHRIQVEVEKEAEAQGYYLHPTDLGKNPEKELAPQLQKAIAAREKEAEKARAGEPGQ